jgi:hypothetical protein
MVEEDLKSEKFAPIIKKNFSMLKLVILPQEFNILCLVYNSNKPITVSDLYCRYVLAHYNKLKNNKKLFEAFKIVLDNKEYKHIKEKITQGLKLDLRSYQLIASFLNKKGFDIPSYRTIESILLRLEVYGFVECLIHNDINGKLNKTFWRMDLLFLNKYSKELKKLL